MEEPPAEEPPAEEPPVEEPSVEPPVEASQVADAAALAETPSEVAVDDATSPAATAETADAPVEPEMIEVWRLAPAYPKREQRKPRTGAPPRRERSADGEKRFQQAAKPRPGGGGGKRDRDQRRPDARWGARRRTTCRRVRRGHSGPRERPVDPDSPFAALEALKREMEKRRRE